MFSSSMVRKGIDPTYRAVCEAGCLLCELRSSREADNQTCGQVSLITLVLAAAPEAPWSLTVLLCGCRASWRCVARCVPVTHLFVSVHRNEADEPHHGEAAFNKKSPLFHQCFQVLWGKRGAERVGSLSLSSSLTFGRGISRQKLFWWVI